MVQSSNRMRIKKTRVKRAFFRAPVPVLILLALAPAPFMVTGCGGGGGSKPPVASSRSASVTVSIIWPETTTKSRAFPVAANSLTITVTDSTGYSQTQTLSRPPAGSASTTVTANFLALSPGAGTVAAQAFASNNGSGAVLSRASATVQLEIGQETGATLNFPSPIVGLSVAPSAPALLVGASVRLFPTATDDRSNTFTPNGAWASSNPGVAVVNASGVVTAVSLGSATITFTDSAFGRTASATVAVQAPAQVTLSPANPQIAPGASITIVATEQPQGGGIIVSPPGTWATSDATIATVSQAGVVTGVRAGSVVVSFTSAATGATGATTVTVRGGDAEVILD